MVDKPARIPRCYYCGDWTAGTGHPEARCITELVRLWEEAAAEAERLQQELDRFSHLRTLEEEAA